MPNSYFMRQIIKGLNHKMWVVFKKEWLDTRRDLKGLLPIALMPLLFALTSYGALRFVAAMQTNKPAFVLAVQNGEAALPLLAALQEAGIKTQVFTGDATAAVTAGKAAMVLRIPPNFGAKFRDQRTANLELIWDISHNEHHATANRVKQAASLWLQTLGAQRLILRGVSPEAAHVGQVIDVNTAKEQQMAMRLLSSVPLFLVLVAFMAAAGVATEIAAGEREGRTLETLLLAPVDRKWVFAGKWLMLVSLSLVVTLLALSGQFAAIALAPTAELGLRIELGLGHFVEVFALLVPLLVLASSLLLFVSLKSRSLKDSQTYTQLLTIMPTLTGLYLLVSGASTSAGLAAIPMLGTQSLITDALSGTPVNSLYATFNALTSLSCGLFFALWGVKSLKLR